MATMISLRALIVAAAVVSILAGCTEPKKKKTASDDDDDEPRAKSSASATASASTASATAAGGDDLAVLDLSPRGDEWKGFSIKAPRDAKVMDDLGDCRIAAKEVDVVLSQKPARSSVEERRKDLETLATTLKGKVTFSNETPSGFDYNLQTPKHDDPGKLSDGKVTFFVVLQVGGKAVGCFPHSSARGEEIVKAREACKTVATAEAVAAADTAPAETAAPESAPPANAAPPPTIDLTGPTKPAATSPSAAATSARPTATVAAAPTSTAAPAPTPSPKGTALTKPPIVARGAGAGAKKPRR